jgi:tetratricopeptide (TPR) repeat protein
MKRYGYWLIAGLLCLGAVAYAQEQKTEDYVHAVTAYLQQKIAALYDSQGRYREAEPLYQRALAAREKMLGPAHSDTLNTQLNYTVTLVNLKQPKHALQMLERMEPRLLELAALQLRHTRQEAGSPAAFSDEPIELSGRGSHLSLEQSRTGLSRSRR